MRIFDREPGIYLVALIVIFSLSGCFTAKNVDKLVAAQYNNELPKPAKKKKADIEVVSTSSTNNAAISTTVHKTDKFLPLLVYWKYDHRQSCSLNPTIAVTNFSNAVNSAATKALTDKLNGKKLELAIEQAPAAFSIVLKENTILVGTWAKVYIEPDFKDLVVSYKLIDGGNALKTGSITVKNTDKNKGLRFFQSWRSATSEYVSIYNASFTTLAKSFVIQLSEVL